MKKYILIGLGAVLLLLLFIPQFNVRADLLTEYTIQAGEQNFSPNEPIWPLFFKKGFAISAKFDSSAYYSLEDWEGDRDWHDWNKLKGLTNYFSANNHTSVIIAWRPDTLAYHFQVAAFTNYPGSNWTVGEPFIVAANTQFNCWVDINRRQAEYMIQQYIRSQITRHEFKRPWVTRQIGTWMGGANNAEGPYGGKASQDMKLFSNFTTK